MTDAQIKHMAERFLNWKLPEHFNPDNGISAARPNYGPNVKWEPCGTNLLDYTQAEAMVRHMVDGLPPPPSEEQPFDASPTLETCDLLNSLADALESAQAEIARLTTALSWFDKHGEHLANDVSSGHSARGSAASEWMREDDADFRSDLREALANASDHLKASRHYLGEAWAYFRAALSEAETGLRKALGR